MAFAPSIKGLDKYQSTTELDAAYLRLDGTNGPQHSIQWDLTPTASPAEGLMYWDANDGTLNLGMPGGSVNLQLGQEQIVRCRNQTGAQINNGQAVYISGESGNKPLITLADADNVTSHQTIGLATEDIAHNSNGYVTISGLVREIDTGGFTAGDLLYLSQTPGELTDTPPTSPAHRIKVGEAITIGVGNGTVFVNVQDSLDMGWIDDVLITSIADKDVLYYDNATGLWKNQSVEELGYVPYTGATADVDLGSFDLETTELRIKASNNHLITSSADDLLVQNFNNQDSIYFETTDASGNTDRVLEIGGTNQTLKIGNERSQSIGNGIIDVSGTWTAANSAAMRFRPIISSGNFYGILFDPSLQSNNIAYGLAFNPVMSVGSNLTMLQFNPTLTTNGNNVLNRYTETLAAVLFNAAVTNTYNAISLGAARSAFNFGGGAPTFNEEMIKLTGGATVNDAVAGGSSITQKGLIFSGFGNVSNTGGTVNVRALEADGGLFSFKFDYGTNNKIIFGAGEDAAIGYDGTDFIIDTALVGTGVIKFANATNWTANGTNTVTISNVAPAGVGTATISKWFTVKDNTGTVYYIPAWT